MIAICFKNKEEIKTTTCVNREVLQTEQDETPKCYFFIHLSHDQLQDALRAIDRVKMHWKLFTWNKDCTNKVGESVRYDAEHYLYVYPSASDQVRKACIEPNDGKRCDILLHGRAALWFVLQRLSRASYDRLSSHYLMCCIGFRLFSTSGTSKITPSLSTTGSP